MNIGKTIRAVRYSLGLSQRAAAKAVGISHVHQCNIENGHVSPTLTLLEKFYEAWGIDLYLYCAALEGDRLNKLAAFHICNAATIRLKALQKEARGTTPKDHKPDAGRTPTGKRPDGKRNAIGRRVDRPDCP